MMISLSLSSAMFKPAIGSPPVPTPNKVAYVANFARDMTIFDSDAFRGGAGATVPLSGATDASDGTVIEARAVSVDDGGATTSAWMDIGTSFGGAWSGTLTVQRSASWYKAQVRVKNSAAAPSQTPNRFGVGLVVFLSEQSSLDRGLDKGFSNTPLESIGNAPGDFQFCAIENRPAGQPDTTATITDREFVYDGNARTAALAAMAASFAKAAPGLKVMILFDTKVGEAQPNTLNDSNTDRLFTNVAALRDIAKVDGADAGLAVLSHLNTLPDDMLDDYYPWAWLGLDPAGSPEPGVDPAGTFPTVTRNFGSSTYRLNHIWAEAFPELLSGRMMMATYTPGGPGEDEITSTNSVFEQRRAGFERLVARLPGQVINLGSNNILLKETTFNGLGIGIHPAADDERGLPERYRMFGYGILRAAGLAGWTPPTLDVVEWTPNYLRLASSAGPVTTTHRAGGGSTNFPADPASSATPGQAEVLGFMDGTLTPPTRVELTDVNGQTASGDTILDPNTSLPVGAGQIIIYPESGQVFDGLSKMYYGLGGYGVNVGTFTNGSSNQDGAPWLTYRMVEHLPIVDMGLPNMAGWQVQCDSDVEAINLTNGLAQGEPTFAVVSGSPSFTSSQTNGNPAGITVEARFQRGAGSQFRVFDFDGTTFGRLNFNAAGDLRVEMKDGNQTTWFDQTIPAAMLGATDDALHTLRVAIDAAGARIDVFLDDVATTDSRFGSGSVISATPGFRGNRKARMIVNGNDGVVSWLRVWREVAPSAATPASTPWIEVVADNNGNPVYRET